MRNGPVFGSVADKVNQYIAATDAHEFTARDIANAIGDVRVNVVSAALSKLKSDKKITYRIIPHEHWGRPIHMYLNPREAGVQVPVVTPPTHEPLHVVRLGRREIVNPGCTRIVEEWIEKQLSDRPFAAEGGIRFTTTLITKETGVPITRVSALLNTMRYKHKIKFAEKDGNRNVYFTTKRMFASYKRRRKAPIFTYTEVPSREREYIPEVRKAEPNKAHGLVDHLLETAIKIEKTGATREICLNLIETLCVYLRVGPDAWTK